ncbi:MFS transporter [Caulobacter sp. D4A]|uniref:MFS transporter n=1 Tax=unclassified Caulobacter TaxID=2648921 RepID=UPI000D727C8B|nr:MULTISPECIES: MFS transporter [unclassified Caulobacter]PXA89734.1 MFS transporter [Caulobacter sp. D4A]PXA89967.1 MFS transporter [Caulobacter sp. D5]
MTALDPTTDLSPPRIAAGTARFRRMSLALFLGGFSTFSLLYCVQPLLPTFARDFSLTPAQSSLALSLSTGALAVAILLAGAASQSLGRKGLMFASMSLAALLNLAAAFAPSWPMLLLARAAEGFLLGGVPAVAMAYVGEEMEPRDLGAAMGLYVAGTAFGGMAGRVGMGLLVEVGSWRSAMATIGALDLLAAAAFFLLLPRSRCFQPTPAGDRAAQAAAWGQALADRRLLALFAVGFCLTGVFVTIFNYAGFRLEDPPYVLSQGQTSLIFLVYAFGVVASSTAGKLADRWGRRTLLGVGLATMLAGVALTLPAGLPWIVAGVALVTIGFFIAHAVASGWVGALAGKAKGQAAALYLLFYYVGSSLAGSAGGGFWRAGGWPAVAAFTTVLAVIAGVLALRLKETRHG